MSHHKKAFRTPIGCGGYPARRARKARPRPLEAYQEAILSGPDNPCWQLLNSTDPKFAGLKAQCEAEIRRVVAMAEARLLGLTEALARNLRDEFRVLRGDRP